MRQESFRILFLMRKGRTKKDGFATIYARITTGSFRQEIYFNCEGRPELWNQRKERMMGTSRLSLKINEMLGGGSVPNFIGNPATKHWAILAFTLWTGFGTNVLVFNGAIGRIPAEVMESTKLDGVGMTRELFQFIVPLIWPTFSTILLMSLGGFFSFVQPILLLEQESMGGNRFSEAGSIGYYIYYYMSTRKELLSALGLCFTALSVPVVFLVRWALNKLSSSIEY